MGDEEVMAGGVNYFLKRFGRDEKGREKQREYGCEKLIVLFFLRMGKTSYR